MMEQKSILATTITFVVLRYVQILTLLAVIVPTFIRGSTTHNTATRDFLTTNYGRTAPEPFSSLNLCTQLTSFEVTMHSSTLKLLIERGQILNTCLQQTNYVYYSNELSGDSLETAKNILSSTFWNFQDDYDYRICLWELAWCNFCKDCKRAHLEQIEQYYKHLVSNLQSKFNCNLWDEHQLSDDADNFGESFAESLSDCYKAVQQGIGLSMVILLFTVVEKR